MPDYHAISRRLEAINQDHVLRFMNELTPEQQNALLDQLDSFDLDALPALVDRYVLNPTPHQPPTALEPAPFYPRDESSPDHPWNRDDVANAGRRLLAKGKVAAFVVAGGQGSRLGFDGPKGCYPAGAVTGKPLFRFFAEAIRKAQDKHGAEIRWYVMTSPLNHEPTVAYFKDNDHFGLDPDQVMLFPQGVMPSFDQETGRMLLAAKDRVATNPDGHGGSLTALARSGALDDMRAREIEHISYFQVDNPITHILDPVFIGLHTAAPDSSAEMSSKMIPKRDPREKVGIFCRVGDRLEMIEYSDLPDELAEKRGEGGDLLFLAGNPAIHLLSVEFVARLTSDPDWQLPYHRAVKAVEHVDLETGKPVKPAAPNAVKLEKFVFDALARCRRSAILETERVEEFAPIKNAEGDDSPASSAALQTERAARWLEAAGVKVPRKPDGTPDCTIELSPLTAVEPDDLKNADLPSAIEPGARIVI